MAFWWASQGKNYETAIEQGTLWTCARSDGTLPSDRAIIKRITQGDIVFHHFDRHLRAVSVVTAPWCDAARPDGYPKVHEDDLDVGWLVTVNPIVEHLSVHFNRTAELLPHGSPGPLDRNGKPQQKYLSALDPDQGTRLLTEVGLIDTSDPSDDSTLSPDITDVQGLTGRRLEQALLRAHLLQGMADGTCGLCGRDLPAGLLVAAHIKPRRQCTDAERWDFPSAAMLACALGCDALFEHGYVTVDRTGTIAGGTSTNHPTLAGVVESLIGRPCPAYTDARSEAFHSHHEAHAGMRSGIHSSALDRGRQP